MLGGTMFRSAQFGFYDFALRTPGCAHERFLCICCMFDVRNGVHVCVCVGDSRCINLSKYIYLHSTSWCVVVSPESLPESLECEC